MMFFRLFVTVSAVWLLAVSTHSASAQLWFGTKDTEIDDFVDIRMESDQVVGLGLAIVRNGRVVYSQGYGDEDREKGIKVSPSETRFRWASVAKTLTAVLAVQADEMSAVELDKNIELYYPHYKMPNNILTDRFPFSSALPKWTNPITLRDILTHMSGIQHYSNGLSSPVPPRSLINKASTNTGMEWALKYWVDNPLVQIPGHRRSYSTPAFNLAGVTLEYGLGDSFDNLIQENIAVPAAMTTLRPDTNWNRAPRRAAGYRVTSAGQVVRDGDDDVS